MTKKKILFLMPSLVGGGAENALIKVLKAFDYDNYDVTLLLVSRKGYYLKEVPDNVKILYLFKNHTLVKILGYLQKKYNWSFLLKWVFRRKVKDSYDTAVSFLDSNFTDLLFLLNSDTKKITWVHSSYVSNKNFNKFYQNKKYLKRVIENRYRKLDTIVFVSNDAKKEFIEVMGEFENMIVLYNLFDDVEIKEKANKPIKGFNKNVFTFIALGSLIPVKGYDLLIDAASIVADLGYSFRVLILGSGYLEPNLTKKINKLGLEEVVELYGYQENPFAFIKQSDVFVMTSVSEALPSALCEAMIIGKPILITNTAGCREVIEFGKYGIMTDRNPESFAQKMREMIENPNKVNQYSSLALEKAKEFNKENILSQYYEILDA